MAIFKPSLDELGQLVTPLNDGELRVAHALNGLDDEWTIYVQPRLGMDVPDFVAVHDRRGVCRRSRSRTGPTTSIDPQRTAPSSSGTVAVAGPRRIENPRYQAYRYRSTIYEQFFALPDDGTDVPPSIRAIVVLLNHSTEHARRVLPAHGAPATPTLHWSLGRRRCLPTLGRCSAGMHPRSRESSRCNVCGATFAESSVTWEPRQPIRLSDGAKNIESNPSNRAPPASCAARPDRGKSFGLAARAARLAKPNARTYSCCRTT